MMARLYSWVSFDLFCVRHLQISSSDWDFSYAEVKFIQKIIIIIIMTSISAWVDISIPIDGNIHIKV